MKKIKVMHVLNTGGYSGAENVVITMINSMRDTVNATYVSPEGMIRNILNENMINFVPVKKVTPFQLKRVIREVHPDVIHAHDFTAGVMAAFTFTSIPIINHLHNNSLWIKKIGIKSMLYYICSMKFKKILTVSESVMNEYVFGKYLKKKSVVVGNPIDKNKIKKLANEQENNQYYDVVVLGRLTEAKNPSLFIEIVEQLVKKHPGLKSAMIGDGELRVEIEKQIEDKKLKNNIELLGFQSNPYTYLNHAKIVCMPSKWEGFGLAAVEALILGKPVVAAPVGGLVNIVDGQCGKLCTTEEEYVEEIERLLTDFDYYTKKQKCAFEREKQFEDLKIYMKKINDSYYEVLGI